MPPKIKSQKYYILYSVLEFVSIYFLKFNKSEFVFRLLDTRCFFLPINPFYACNNDNQLCSVVDPGISEPGGAVPAW